MLIGDLLAHRAQTHPHAPYWRQGGEETLYGEMESLARRAAFALTRQGANPPGTMIGVMAMPSARYAALHFAAAKAGLVLAHLNPRWSPDETAWGIRLSGAGVMFVDHHGAEAAAKVREGFPQTSWIWLDRRQAPPWATPWETFVANTPDRPFPLPSFGVPTDVFQLLFTSGTTGRPKGVRVSHQSKFNLAQTHALNLGLRMGDRVLSSLALCHHFGQWLNLTAVPLVGGVVQQQEGFQAQAVAAALAQDGITHLPMVPTQLRRLLDESAAQGLTLKAPELRMIVFGGEPSPAGLAHRLAAAFPRARMFQGFGQTETGFLLGLHHEQMAANPHSLGWPDPRVDIRLVDSTGKEVPPGQAGEITARTPYLMNGYHGNPEATGEYFAFGRGWGRTGDLARREPDGSYTLAGRKTDLIISGGMNVYPAEVERVLLDHPAVLEVVVVGAPDEQWGETPVAFLLVIPGKMDHPAQELEHHCRDRLAHYKCPTRWVFPEHFPRTTSGKANRGALKAAARRSDATEDFPPTD